jgi:hypothetical protein
MPRQEFDLMLVVGVRYDDYICKDQKQLSRNCLHLMRRRG